MRDHREAVLITGVFGSGKSSVAVEMAAVLETRRAPYAVLDLDFLAWFHTGRDDGPSEHDLLVRNLAAVVANYRATGVRYFIVAGAVRDERELDRLRAELPTRTRVVRLTVPIEEIEVRLRADVTTGRRDDLREAATWIEAATGVGLDDLTVANEGPIRDVAIGILAWLGWT